METRTMSTVLARAIKLQNLHFKIMEIGDEEIEDIWLMTIPDGAIIEDFIEIAKDIDDFNYVWSRGNELLKVSELV